MTVAMLVVLATGGACAMQPVPPNPCDDGRPLECSVPGYVTIASDFHDEFADYFDKSCVVHDFCYRYGFKTYGLEHSDCDDAFLKAMKSQCNRSMNLDPAWRARCLSAALQFHAAVEQRGEAAFQRQAGQYCEYAGPQ